MSKIFDEFFLWLRIHSSEYKMRYEAMSWDEDWGYIKACDVIAAELKRLIQEHKDDSDRIKGNQGVLGEEVPYCDDNPISEA